MVERSCLVDSIRIFGVQGKHGVAAIEPKAIVPARLDGENGAFEQRAGAASAAPGPINYLLSTPSTAKTWKSAYLLPTFY
jgi:hypothetical protein